jgi:lysophospholipase L1-like esterase
MNSPQNNIQQPFLILLFIAVVMTAISFFNVKASFLPDFLSEIKKPIPVLTEIKTETKTIVTIDSVTKDTIKKLVKIRVPVIPTELTDTANVKNIVSFAHFFQAIDSLKAGKRKKIRVAYFGDSMIEGDFITDDLRKLLQSKYGGNGVGYVPITSVVAHFRQTITHSFSSDWSDYNFSKRGKKDLPLSGHVFYGTDKSDVQYKSVKKYGLFQNVYLLHGPGSCSLAVTTDTMNRELILSGEKSFNKTPIIRNAGTKRLDIKNIDCQNIGLYGLSFETESGVTLDNYSFRGISGLEYNSVTAEMFAQTAAEQPYDLIILHYGLNVATDSITSYHWYESKFEKVVQRFKTYFPKATILMVSISDKAYKKDGAFVTSPAVPALVKAQERISKKENVSFWNLYQAMGGYNSMVKWATEKPILAHTDYTHVNNGGARKIATLLYNHLESEYKRYKNQDSTVVTLPDKNIKP